MRLVISHVCADMKGSLLTATIKETKEYYRIPLETYLRVNVVDSQNPGSSVSGVGTLTLVSSGVRHPM